MKNPIVPILIAHLVGFSAAALAHLLGFLPVNVLTPAGVTVALVSFTLVAFAWSDYRRKPQFRVRRTSAQPGLSWEPVSPSADWTYTTRSS